MQAQIERIEPGTLVVGGPRILVAPQEAGASPAERYQLGSQASSQGKFPAGTALVALYRPDVLATPDQIRAPRAAIEGKEITVDVELRRYRGELAANVETEALVEVELGRLASGKYRLTVNETTLGFDRMDHPEQAKNPTVQTHKFTFEVT